MKIIAKIDQDNDLRQLVDRCDARTQESFFALAQVASGDAAGRFEKLVGQVRSNLAFHYDHSGKLIKRALEDRASRQEARNSTVTRGDHAYLWHFKAARECLSSGKWDMNVDS